MNAGPDYWYPEPKVTAKREENRVPVSRHSRRFLLVILAGFLIVIILEFAELIRVSGRLRTDDPLKVRVYFKSRYDREEEYDEYHNVTRYSDGSYHPLKIYTGKKLVASYNSSHWTKVIIIEDLFDRRSYNVLYLFACLPSFLFMLHCVPA